MKGHCWTHSNYLPPFPPPIAVHGFCSSPITFSSMHCLCLGSTVDGVEYSTPNSTSSVAKWTGGGSR